MEQIGNQLVLVIEDDPVARMVCIQQLKKIGFAVAEAEDGEAAIELLGSLRPDLIMLDVEMGRLNGYDVCRFVREHEHLSVCPVIMLTSHDDDSSIQSAFDAGATDFASKPVNWSLMHHKIRYVLRGAELLHDLAESESVAMMGSWRKLTDERTVRVSAGLRRLIENRPVVDDDILSVVHPKDRDYLSRAFEKVLGGSTINVTHRLANDDQATRYVQHRAGPIFNYQQEIVGIAGTMMDVTAREKASSRIRLLAFQDRVTGFPNRVAFTSALETLLKSRENDNAPFGVLYLNLDDFKRINDSMGHGVGDALLKAVCDRLSTVSGFENPFDRIVDLRAGAEEFVQNEILVARMGGDEFAMLLPRVDGREQLEQTADTVCELLTNAFEIGQQPLTVSCSLGIAMYPADGNEASMLIKNADSAMHTAKRSGKNAVCHYERSMSHAAQRLLQIENGLRGALQNNELSLVFQPQINVADNTIAGVESLLRWQSAELGTVSPIEFIPVAEETGLIQQIGQWVMAEACAQMSRWREQNLPIPRVGVNVSYGQFIRDDFVEQVRLLLESHALPAECLDLEMTESVLAEDVETTSASFNALRTMGVGISIDDFGTGYSSLSYLKHFTIDRLKIDRSFVRDIAGDRKDRALTSSIIKLAEGLDMRIVVEGVEDREQLAVVTGLGADEIQGYLYSRPLACPDLADWVESFVQPLKRSA